MSTFDIVRAWKDADFRLSLGVAERAALPAHPAGFIELSDADLDSIAGGLRGTDTQFCSTPCTLPSAGCVTTKMP